MFKKLTLAGAAFAMGAVSLIPAAPAMAQSRHYSSRHYDGHGYRTYRGGNRHYYAHRAREKCNDGDGGTKMVSEVPPRRSITAAAWSPHSRHMRPPKSCVSLAT